MSSDDLERYQGNKHEGRDALSPYPVSRLAPAIDLVSVAKEIERAHESIKNVAGGKLELLAEQMNFLRAQAEQIMREAQESMDLHQVECRFRRVPGQVMHLYRRDDGTRYFSLLSPSDWGQPPHPYEGSYRLRGDRSFEVVE